MKDRKALGEMAQLGERAGPGKSLSEGPAKRMNRVLSRGFTGWGKQYI